MPKVIALSVQYFCWSVGVYGFVIWLPSMLKTKTMGMVEVGWLSAVPYLAAIIAMLIVSTISDRAKVRKHTDLAMPAVGREWPFTPPYAIGPSNFWLSFALLTAAGACMYAPYGTFFAYIAEILPTNVSGGSMALINSLGALGSFAGSYAVGLLNGATGNSGASYLTMAAALVVAAVITMFLAERPRPA